MLKGLNRLRNRRRAAAESACRPPNPPEEQFARLVTGVRDYAIFLLDRDGCVQSWNAGAERIKGYRAEEIVGQHFSRFYPRELATTGWPEHELEVAAATGRFEDEAWRIRKDGSRFWANVIITALRDESGNVRGFLKITRDLTDRKQAEEKLRISEERFRLLVNGIKDHSICRLDPQGRVATWNAGAELLEGYTSEEIIGEHISHFYTREDQAEGRPEQDLRRAETEGIFEDEGWRVRKDGTRYWANVVLTALRDEEGVLHGFGQIMRDMTERRHAEENARRLLAEEAARQAAEASAQEAQRAQREERRHREQLHVTLSSIGDAVMVADTAGAVSFMNPVAESLTGWSLEAATGLPLDQVFVVINEESRETVENPVARVLREGVVVGLANHTVLMSRDGREIPIDDSAAPIRADDGSIAGVVLVFRDVTEERKALEVRRHLAYIVESSDDAIVGKDLDGIVVSWNQGAERLYGYRADEIIGQSLSLLAPPDQPDELPRILERIRRGERIEHFETVRIRKDGSRVDVSVTVSPIRDAAGRIVGASKIARDITSAKRHESSLRFLAQASRQLGNIQDVPKSLRAIASLAVPGFADGCCVDRVASDGTLQRVASTLAGPADTPVVSNAVQTGRAELIAEPDLSSWFRSALVVPVNLRDQVLAVFTFLTFDSGRRFNPEDLQIAGDLAHRTAIALENARLYEELTEGDRQKNAWIAMLAHELRNPLAPILNALHLMRMPGADGPALERARQLAERQVHQMVRLVDDLLDISRILRNRIVLRKEKIDLANVVARGVETVQPGLDERNQRLDLSLPDEPVRIEGDPARLVQVVANLLHNASKYSEPGSRIVLALERDGTEAVLSVRDEGEGIPPELLPRIFELFTQGEQSLERSPGGLGIGLTVVSRLVELHGGTISAYSAGPGKGSEFVIRLPGVESESEAEEPETGPADELPRSVRRILLVDDNSDAAESFAMLLRMSGHEVFLAHDGPGALEAADEHRPEVVVLDIGLPGLSGYEVARRLRERPEFHDTILIAMTGYGQDDDRRQAREAGFDYHVTKPVGADQLEQLFEAREENRAS